MFLLLRILFATWLILRVQADSTSNAVSASDGDSIEKNASLPKPTSLARPTIYTYFEQIDASKRTTGMTDEQDLELLSLWREQWEKAGYAPVLLTEETLNHPNFEKLGETNESRYQSIRTKLEALPVDDFGKVLFRRWLAMAAVGGGWYSDYDNFPLWNLDHEDSFEKVEVVSGKKNLRKGTLVVYDIMSPTLAFGVGDEWLNKLEALLEDTIRKCPPNSKGFDCFYTDSLAIHSIRADGDPKLAPNTENKVAIPFEGKDPVSLDDPELCAARGFRKKFTVHFSPQALQRSRYVPPKERHPRYRSKLAGDWLHRWQELCHRKNDDATTKKSE